MDLRSRRRYGGHAEEAPNVDGNASDDEDVDDKGPIL
jgi:hypothetical protein